jgi:hypothetical protein
MLSQDSWLYQMTPAAKEHAARSAAVTTDTADAAASTFLGGGGMATIQLLGHGGKIMPIPRFNAALAGTGSLSLILGAFVDLYSSRALSAAELHAEMPERLRRVRRTHCPDDDGILIVGGYDATRGTGFGYVYASGDDFAGSEIPVGSFIGPAIDPDYDERGLIERLRHSAAAGFNVDRFHEALYCQQCEAFLDGKLAPGCAVGGALHHVEVTAAGITITTAPDRADEMRAA